MAVNPLVSSTPTTFTASDKTAIQKTTFTFIAGWILLILILVLANQSRLGHVIIYYSLLLMILFILVTEYQQLTPFFSGFETIGQLQQQPTTPPVDPHTGHST
jgi:ABC-type transport system involved in cytochrome bd biosynthesis fused ATPase/permease subunit